jgi:hypothetical protein
MWHELEYVSVYETKDKYLHGTNLLADTEEDG